MLEKNQQIERYSIVNKPVFVGPAQSAAVINAEKRVFNRFQYNHEKMAGKLHQIFLVG